MRYPPSKSGKKAAAPAASIPGIPDEVMRRGDYLSRDEALAVLAIKPQTLYSYVSRGFIRSVPHPDGRSSFYLREDVNKVRLRSIARAGQGPVAAGAMRWGEPVILTAITEMTDAGPRYRDRLAIDLARARAPFENVAELLWTGEYSDEPLIWQQTPDPPGLRNLLSAGAKLHTSPHILQMMALTVLGMGVAEGNRRDRIRAGDTPVASARRLIRALTGTLGFLGKAGGYTALRDGQTIAEGIAAALGMDASAPQLDALNGALVLVADHELNPATFAARVAASGSVDLQSGVGAAICTHYGTLIGRACDRIEQLFEPPADPDTVLDRATSMIAAARSLPGFNHPHYPNGDPRARVLIELAIMTGGSRRVVGNMLMSLRRLEEECGARPGVECGLVLLCRALGMPNQSAAGVYALGRTAGWVAHILEQRLAGFVIRPRAKFAGAD